MNFCFKTERIVFCLLFFFVAISSKGQSSKSVIEDSVIRLGMEKSNFFLENDDGDSSGTVLVEIFKDSVIKLKRIWSSQGNYSVWDRKEVAKVLNEKYGKYIETGYDAVLPIFCYNWELDPQIRLGAIKEAREQMASSKKRILKPIEWTFYKRTR